MAVVGVRPLLTGKFERIGHEQWDQIGRLDRTIHRLARDLARGQLDHSEFPAIDYEKYLAALSSDVDPAQIETVVQQFPLELHDVTTSYLGQIGRALRYLRSKFPISTVKTIFGSTNLPASDLAILQFESLLETIDRPLSVFSMVDSGRLTSDMAVAMMAVYPSIYSAVVGAIVQRVVLEKAKLGDKFDPTFGPGLAVLLAVPGVDANLRQQLQTPAPQAQNKPQAPKPGKPQPTLAATPSQKLELNA